jgi:ribonuclease J
MQLTVHRGAHEVGGNCVEVSQKDSTIILDIGLPLNFNSDDDINDVLPQPLFKDIIQGKKLINGIFLSHPHLDHYGLIGSLPKDIAVFCGSSSYKLMELTALMNPSIFVKIRPLNFKHLELIKIGALRITPYLMDHSAFDSYAFLIEAGKKTIFYTGDFRGHGRKSKLFDRLIASPPIVDILMTEGTTVGPRSDEIFLTEAELENRFVDVVKKTQGIVFVTAAGQNIDRLVTIFRAAKRTGRKFIIDPYTAEVLDSLEDYPRLPKTSWPRIRVAFSRPIAEILEKAGRQDILEKHRKNGVRWPRINEYPNEFVVLIRPSSLGPVKRYLDIKNATWIYSMWPGYLKRSRSLKILKEYFKNHDINCRILHTSGHAKLSDLKKLVNALKPETIIPIHSFYAEKFQEFFSNVRLVKDREVLEL